MSILQLLKLEYYKFRSSKIILILLGFFSLLSPFAIFVGREIFGNTPPPPPFPRIDSFYEFPSVWDYQGYIGNWLIFFFLGYVSVYIVTSDVANKTMRQNIITGMTRFEYFKGKVVAILAISLYATFLYTISCFTIGILNTDGWDIELLLDSNFAILRYFLMSMGYMSFGLLIGFWIRKSGLAVAIYFIYQMIVEFILKMLTGGLIYKFGLEKQINVMNYYPMNVVEDLHPNPLVGLGGKAFSMSTDFGSHFSFLVPKTNAIIFSVIYITFFLFLAYTLLKRKDV